jgi:hypothetical protein
MVCRELLAMLNLCRILSVPWNFIGNATEFGGARLLRGSYAAFLEPLKSLKDFPKVLKGSLVKKRTLDLYVGIQKGFYP